MCIRDRLGVEVSLGDGLSPGDGSGVGLVPLAVMPDGVGLRSATMPSCVPGPGEKTPSAPADTTPTAITTPPTRTPSTPVGRLPKNEPIAPNPADPPAPPPAVPAEPTPAPTRVSLAPPALAVAAATDAWEEAPANTEGNAVCDAAANQPEAPAP